MKDDVLAFLKMLWTEHRGASIGTSVGVFLGVFILLFGVWRVAFVLLCAGVGLWLGHVIDAGNAVWPLEKFHWDEEDFHKLK